MVSVPWVITIHPHLRLRQFVDALGDLEQTSKLMSCEPTFDICSPLMLARSLIPERLQSSRRCSQRRTYSPLACPEPRTGDRAAGRQNDRSVWFVCYTSLRARKYQDD
jgi:hypothetical protein